MWSSTKIVEEATLFSLVLSTSYILEGKSTRGFDLMHPFAKPLIPMDRLGFQALTNPCPKPWPIATGLAFFYLAQRERNRSNPKDNDTITSVKEKEAAATKSMSWLSCGMAAFVITEGGVWDRLFIRPVEQQLGYRHVSVGQANKLIWRWGGLTMAKGTFMFTFYFAALATQKIEELAAADEI